MNIRMSSVHVNTLCKLKELADRHDCLISFGLDEDSSDEVNWDLLVDKTDMTEEIMDELLEKLILNSGYYKCSKYWFCLYDKKTKKYNRLCIIEEETRFTFDSINCYYDFSEEAEEWIENNVEYDRFYQYSTSYQEIFGFDSVDKKDINVYREGMLLKFFGDLVCDYLGEERIHEVY